MVINKSIRRLIKVLNFLNRVTEKHLIGISIFLIFISLNVSSESSSKPLDKNYITTNYENTLRDRIEEKLVSEVRLYIHEIAPTSKIDPELLVKLCYKHDIDISLVLAQGQIESHFGTKGMAVKTNSIFNVGTWSSKKVLYRYQTQNESIEPYLILLKNDYLVGKNVELLTKNGGYTNYNGHRFASSRDYEWKIRTLMIEIKYNTEIVKYQNIMKMNDKDLLSYIGNGNENIQ